jgi:hypothetical protein
MWGAQFRPDFRNPPCGAIFELVVSAFYSSCLSRVKTSRNSLLGAEIVLQIASVFLAVVFPCAMCRMRQLSMKRRGSMLLADVSPVQCMCRMRRLSMTQWLSGGLLCCSQGPKLMTPLC